MPKLNVDMFDTEPSVGDKIKVLGTIKSIDTKTGDVEASYDDVAILTGNNSDQNSGPQDMNQDQNGVPQSQSLDAALAKAFPNTQ